MPLADRAPVVDGRSTQWIGADPHARLANRVDVDHRRQVADVLTHEVVPPTRPHCVDPPGIATPEEISAVVKAVAPKPVNLLVGAAGPSLEIAGDLGVRRIKVGGALARMAWTGS